MPGCKTTIEACDMPEPAEWRNDIGIDVVSECSPGVCIWWAVLLEVGCVCVCVSTYLSKGQTFGGSSSSKDLGSEAVLRSWRHERHERHESQETRK